MDRLPVMRRDWVRDRVYVSDEVAEGRESVEVTEERRPRKLFFRFVPNSVFKTSDEVLTFRVNAKSPRICPQSHFINHRKEFILRGWQK